MTDIREILNSHADAAASEIVSWRHHLHQNPELSNREEKTAAYIAERMREFGLDEIRTGVSGHGVIGVLRGGAGGDGVAVLRADMDALPVPDESGVDFSATVRDETYPGGAVPVSHACGHDCHMAMVLGAMKVFAENRDAIPGTVVALFQPAEEGAPIGEEGGARVMMNDGVLDDLHPTMAFGMHVQPLPKGMVAVREGVQFGASSMIKIAVQGKQVHASTPWHGVDPMPAVGQILTGIGQIYRQTDAFTPFTVTIGHIDDVGRFNVVPGQVTLWGTIRALDDDVMAEVQERVSRLAEGAGAAFGCEVEAEFLQPVPALENKTDWVEQMRPSIVAVVGEDNVVSPPPTLGYDDVSEFVRAYGGLYIGLGVQDTEVTGKGLIPTEGGRGLVPNHHPAFYADDDSLIVGVKLFLRVAFDHLASLSK